MLTNADTADLLVCSWSRPIGDATLELHVTPWATLAPVFAVRVQESLEAAVRSCAAPWAIDRLVVTQ